MQAWRAIKGKILHIYISSSWFHAFCVWWVWCSLYRFSYRCTIGEKGELARNVDYCRQKILCIFLVIMHHCASRSLWMQWKQTCISTRMQATAGTPQEDDSLAMYQTSWACLCGAFKWISQEALGCWPSRRGFKEKARKPGSYHEQTGANTGGSA